MPEALSHLLMADPTAPLSGAVLLKHSHTMLIQDLPILNPSLSRATGSMIASNIGDLVTKKRTARMEIETL